MLVLRVFNFALILIALCLIGFWSAVFYLGSEYSYAKLKEELLVNFLNRYLGFFVLSFLVSVGIWVLNWLVYRSGVVAVGRDYPIRIAAIALAVLSMGALVGTFLFFSNCFITLTIYL